jgi:hypothetical protein
MVVAATSFNLNKKRHVVLYVVFITKIEQHMLGVSFDGLIMSQHKSNEVLGNGYKYIHCDLVDVAI